MNQFTYGCFNREPFKAMLVVQDGWIDTIVHGQPSRSPRMKEIAFRNSPECGYQLSEIGNADPKCAGCRWKVQASTSKGQDKS